METLELDTPAQADLNHSIVGGQGCGDGACSHRGGCNADHSMERQVLSMPNAAKLARCRDFKIEASALFAEGQFRRALERFRKILVYLDYTIVDSDAESKEVDSLQIMATLNACVCALKMADYRQCISLADRVLRLCPGHAKALYCRAKAHRLLGELQEATKDIEACQAVARGNRDALVETLLLRCDAAELSDGQRKLGQAMFASCPNLPSS